MLEGITFLGKKILPVRFRHRVVSEKDFFNSSRQSECGVKVSHGRPGSERIEFDSQHSDQKGMPSALKGGYQGLMFNGSISPSERD